MKKSLLFLVGCFFVMPLFGQSLMKSSLIYSGAISTVGQNVNPYLGVSVGHQHYLLSGKIFNILMGENLEYKKAGFTYFNGGIGNGTVTNGDINFINLKVDARTRIGKKIFFDFGLYAAYSLSNWISNGKAFSEQNCYPPSGIILCPDSKKEEVINNFSNLDYGILYGIGFHYKKIIVNFDIQGGLAKVVSINRSIVTLQQINLSVAFPFSFKKKEDVK
jgi:hypothetical protein